MDDFFSYQYDENALNVCVIYFVIDLTKVTWDPCPSKMSQCQLLSVMPPTNCAKCEIQAQKSFVVIHACATYP